MQIGADAWWNTEYYSQGWNPAIGAFINQNEVKYSNGPFIDAFVNMQWKRACIFVKLENAGMGVISCGAGNKYGHPHEETLSILRDAKVDVYRTDLQGTITIGSDGQNFTVGTEHFVPDSQLNPTDPSSSSTAQQAYIGNVNSKKFHLPTCANLPAEKNQVLFSSYDEAIAAGYTPCASCIK